MNKLITAIFIAANASVAFAGFTDGNELHRWLQEDEKQNGSHFEAGLFKGYVGGVVDTGDGILFCTTSKVTRGQNSAVVAKYIKNNPEKWNQPAQNLVIEAMKAAFPCKQ